MLKSRFSSTTAVLPPAEIAALGVGELPARVRALGIAWHHAPIRDGHAPDERFEQKWGSLGPELKAALDRGEGVVVHCKGGIGRAGTVASLLLAASEPRLSAETVIRHVRAVRHNAVETVAQERYLQAHIDPPELETTSVEQ